MIKLQLIFLVLLLALLGFLYGGTDVFRANFKTQIHGFDSQLANRVAKVEHLNGDPLCSAFLLTVNPKRATFLTARHCCVAARMVKLKLPRMNRLFYSYDTVLDKEEHSDLCLYISKGAVMSLEPAVVANQLNFNEYVYTYGFPRGYFSVTSGQFTSSWIIPIGERDWRINEINAFNMPGSSGGPVFNADGELVGVQSTVRSDAMGYPLVSGIVPLPFLQRFLIK